MLRASYDLVDHTQPLNAVVCCGSGAVENSTAGAGSRSRNWRRLGALTATDFRSLICAVGVLFTTPTTVDHVTGSSTATARTIPSPVFDDRGQFRGR